MKKLVCRADGSNVIGMGHVMRCIALSEMLRGSFEIEFVICKPSAETVSLLKENDLNCIEISDQLDLTFVHSSDVVVLDGYWFDSNYVKRISDAGKFVVQVDDIPAQEYFCDILINHAIHADYSRSRFHKTCQLLLGPQYAMLRKQFFSVKKENKSFERPDPIALNMGGSDPNNFTLSIAKTLHAISPESNFKILIGGGYKYQAELENWIRSVAAKIEVRKNLSAEEIIDLFRNCALLICPASTIIYEACAVSIPIGCFQTARNQEQIYNGIVSRDCVVPLGNLEEQSDAQLRGVLKDLLSNYHEAAEKVLNQELLIDGLSGTRILSSIQRL